MFYKRYIAAILFLLLSVTGFSQTRSCIDLELETNYCSYRHIDDLITKISSYFVSNNYKYEQMITISNYKKSSLRVILKYNQKKLAKNKLEKLNQDMESFKNFVVEGYFVEIKNELLEEKRISFSDTTTFEYHNEVEVEVDYERLSAYGLIESDVMNQIAPVLDAYNCDDGAVELKEIRDLVITSSAGQRIPLSVVAELRMVILKNLNVSYFEKLFPKK